jgi:SAM-dependent methyltransferase
MGERVNLDRVVLRHEMRRILASLPVSEMDALEISGDSWKDSGFKSFTAKHFPEYDVCAGPLSQSFDLVIAEQVFEHLLYPRRAAQNVYATLRRGGYFILSTPFLQKVHNFPVDCSRWTEMGLKYLLEEAGFELDDIQTWSWGNRAAARANLNPKKFPTYNPYLHSLKNEPQFPVQVWALARRGGSPKT